MTNYEKIKAMSLEEMAELFYKICHEMDIFPMNALKGLDSKFTLIEMPFQSIDAHINWLESEAELEPCPFCGSKIETMYDVTGIMMFICPKCGAYVYFYGAERGAKEIESWNRRVENAID